MCENNPVNLVGYAMHCTVFSFIFLLLLSFLDDKKLSYKLLLIVSEYSLTCAVYFEINAQLIMP